MRSRHFTAAVPNWDRLLQAPHRRDGFRSTRAVTDDQRVLFHAPCALVFAADLQGLRGSFKRGPDLIVALDCQFAGAALELVRLLFQLAGAFGEHLFLFRRQPEEAADHRPKGHAEGGDKDRGVARKSADAGTRSGGGASGCRASLAFSHERCPSDGVGAEFLGAAKSLIARSPTLRD